MDGNEGKKDRINSYIAMYCIVSVSGSLAKWFKCNAIRYFEINVDILKIGRNGAAGLCQGDLDSSLLEGNRAYRISGQNMQNDHNKAIAIALNSENTIPHMGLNKSCTSFRGRKTMQ